MQKSLCLLLLILTNNLLFSEEILSFKLKALKIPVVDFEMRHNSELKQINAKAKTKLVGSFFGAMNNKYHLIYDDIFAPKFYKKLIDQSKYSEDREISYNLKEGTAARKSYLDDKISKNYEIAESTKDIFSALYYVRFYENVQPFILDTASFPWKVVVEELGEETIKTKFGKKNCRHIKIKFIRLNPAPKEKTDLLTYGLANNKHDLHFWFDLVGEKLPYKAVYTMKKMDIIWELTKVENEISKN